MGNIISSEDMYIFWFRNATWKAGVPGTDTQIPFNPIVDSLGIKVPQKVYDLITTANSMYPNIHLDKHMEPSTITFRSYYRDPLLLLTLFTYKGVPTAWTGTNDVITGSFTSRLNVDENIGVQIHLRDVSGGVKHLNLFLDGGKVTGYRWIFNEGDALIEEIDIKFAEITESGCKMDITNGFDDESFNQTGVVQVSSITCLAKASCVEEGYFILYVIDSDLERTRYNVWFDVAGDGVFTASPGVGTDVKCNVSGATDATSVGVIVDTAISALDDVGAENAVGVVTVTNTENGDCIEIADVTSTFTVSTTTKGVVDIDGGWALWDKQLCATKEKVVLTSTCTLTVGGVAIPGLHVKNAVLEIDVDKIMEFVGSSQTVAISYDKVRTPYKATFEGVLKGNNDFTEAIALLSAKTQATVKFLIATNKYMQFTLGVLKDIEGLSIPRAGEPMNVTYVYEGVADSALTFSYTITEGDDPSAMINHTNV